MPRCRNCKDKFEAVHFNQKYCFNFECMQEWFDSEKQKNWKKRKRELKEELKTTKDYAKEAQRVFNTWVRKRDKDKPCISCGRKLKGQYDAGHYFSQGGHANIRYDDRNCFAQCVWCNRNLHGNLIKYTENITTRISEDDFKSLKEIAYVSKKWSKEELKIIIEKYKGLLKSGD